MNYGIVVPTNRYHISVGHLPLSQIMIGVQSSTRGIMWANPGRSPPAARILRRPTAIAADSGNGQQTAGGRRQSRRRGGEPDEGDETDGPLRAPRAPGCKRTVAMHVGYVGTAFRGED